jgi:50S ribosomal protein L16 3-hydroxylase
MTETLTLLGERSRETFLAEYWQKQPLLIRNALPDFVSPISPDELAGLACEEEVESRLLLERDGPAPWSVEHGPLAEERFAHLPDTHWTLLVQECNRYVPELAELMEQFNFIPRWRVDDVMASYAPAQGSVGPHTDQYDVFLIQAHGTRRWQVSSAPVPADNFLPDIDLCIMREFMAEQEWVLQPGDMLYLPPGVAHHGVALEDCITLSVGFRAPSHAELLNSFADHTAAQLNPAQRYADPTLSLQQHPGEISAEALKQVREILQNTLRDETNIAQWFGEFITEPKFEATSAHDIEALDATAFLHLLNANEMLYRDEQTRFAFINNTDDCTLFVNGHAYPLDAELSFAAALLCDHSQWSSAQLHDPAQQPTFAKLLTTLYNQAHVYFL